MTQADVEEQLDELLSEAPEAAAKRMAEQARAHETGDELFVLHGAGELGREMLRRLRQGASNRSRSPMTLRKSKVSRSMDCR